MCRCDERLKAKTEGSTRLVYRYVFVCVYAALIQSDTLQAYGRAKADTRPVGVGLSKKPKDLSVSEREEREHERGVRGYDTLL